MILCIEAHGRTCSAIVRRTRDGLVLDALQPLDQAPLDGEHLIGGCFPDQTALVQAVRSAMLGNIETLDLVDISRSAYARWITLAQTTAARWLAEGVVAEPAAIPNERARVLPSGELEIRVELASGERISMCVPPGEWAWRHRWQ